MLQMRLNRFVLALTVIACLLVSGAVQDAQAKKKGAKKTTKKAAKAPKAKPAKTTSRPANTRGSGTVKGKAVSPAPGTASTTTQTEGPQQNAVTGTVEKDAVDETGAVASVLLKTGEGDLYRIVNDGKGRELLALVGKQVKATGFARKNEAGMMEITVTEFEQLGAAPAAAKPTEEKKPAEAPKADSKDEKKAETPADNK